MKNFRFLFVFLLILVVSLNACKSPKLSGTFVGEHCEYINPMLENNENSSIEIRQKISADGTISTLRDTIFMCIDNGPGILKSSVSQTIDFQKSQGSIVSVSFYGLNHYRDMISYSGTSEVNGDKLMLTLTKDIPISEDSFGEPITVTYVLSPCSDRKFNREYSLLFYPFDYGNELLKDSIWHNQYWLKKEIDD